MFEQNRTGKKYLHPWCGDIICVIGSLNAYCEIRIGLYLHAWTTWHWCIVICTRNRTIWRLFIFACKRNWKTWHWCIIICTRNGTIWRLFIFACKRNWKTWHWCIIICTRYGTIWRLFIFACERNWKTRHRIYLFARVMGQYGVCLYLHANVIGKHDIGV